MAAPVLRGLEFNEPSSSQEARQITSSQKWSAPLWRQGKSHTRHYYTTASALKQWCSLKKVQINLIYYSFFLHRLSRRLGSSHVRLSTSWASAISPQKHHRATQGRPSSKRLEQFPHWGIQGWHWCFHVLERIPEARARTPAHPRAVPQHTILSSQFNTQEQPARHPRDSWTRGTAAVGNSVMC